MSPRVALVTADGLGLDDTPHLPSAILGMPETPGAWLVWTGRTKSQSLQCELCLKPADKHLLRKVGKPPPSPANPRVGSSGPHLQALVHLRPCSLGSPGTLTTAASPHCVPPAPLGKCLGTGASSSAIAAGSRSRGTVSDCQARAAFSFLCGGSGFGGSRAVC